ncbi:MAG: lipase [Pirellula sp.]|nr:lipase [Pirellula sp.]
MKLCLPTLVILICFAPLTSIQAVEPSRIVRDICYKSTPEGDLSLDLYYPEGEPRGKCPLVVYTHGGGWTTGSKRSAQIGAMVRAVDKLLVQGFCVASVDYRLYVEGGPTRVRDCVADCKDAVRYLAQRANELRIDAEHVFTFGDSAGGHIAQMLLLSPAAEFPEAPGRAAAPFTMIAGVSWYGPCDFEKTELFRSDEQTPVRDRFEARILPSDADPKDKLRLYREISPVNYLRAESRPLLMIQGDKDTTIPVRHARYMKERADAVGAPVDIVVVANAGHNWRRVDADIEPSVEEIVEKTASFLKQELERSAR